MEHSAASDPGGVEGDTCMGDSTFIAQHCTC